MARYQLAYLLFLISVAGCGGQTVTAVPSAQTSVGNWQTWGQTPPTFADCSPSPCNGVQWSQAFGIASPSLSGNATKFSLGGASGTTAYGDALFSAQLIGQNSPQLPDSGHILLPEVTSLTYDTYFYIDSTADANAQNLEFDVSMYMLGTSMIWGHQCEVNNSHNWDIWNNQSGAWVGTGINCTSGLLVGQWNHLTINMQRIPSGNTLIYQSIVLNGNTINLNQQYASTFVSSESTWWGMTANFQLDGNATQAPYSAYMDNFTVTAQTSAGPVIIAPDSSPVVIGGNVIVGQ